MSSALFSPISLRDLSLPNRIVVAPMCQYSAEEGCATDWHLIHLASEGLFPQLLVIPLHRDHKIITMAAGKNDVIKLLPPLTLTENEAERFLTACDEVLCDCHGPARLNWSGVHEIATATLRRRLIRAAPGRAPPGGRA